MGFFSSEIAASRSITRGEPTLELMHRLQCRVCPLDKCKGTKHPHLEPNGAKEPLVYVLGAAPVADDDEDGLHFSNEGEPGRIVRTYLRKYSEELGIKVNARFNNITRTFSGEKRAPTRVEVECCRPSIHKDIQETQPIAIFGFGQEVLSWAAPGLQISSVRGRRFPIKIGAFTTWFYCFNDPSEVKQVPKGRKRADPQREFVFKFDIRRAIKSLRYNDEPFVVTRKQAMEGIEVITKQSGGADRVVDLLAWASKQAEAGFDIETDRLRPYHKKATMLSAAVSVGGKNVWDPGTTFTFGLDHAEAGWSPDERARIDVAFKAFLKSKCRKAVHQLAFELEWMGVMYGHEYIRDDNWDDSVTQAFILDERTGNRKQKHGPASLHFGCMMYAGLPLKDLSPDIDRKRMAEQRLAVILPYNGMDAKYHLLLKRMQHAQLEREGLLVPYQMMLERVPTVVLTQMRGAPIDAVENQRLYDEYFPRVQKAEKDIEANPWVKKFNMQARHLFNPGSDPDIVALLRDIMQLDLADEEGNWATDKKVLGRVKDPIGKSILEFRRSSKALSTYILPLRPESPHNYDGEIHSVLNTTVAITGRLSSEDPNTQNFPTRDEELGKMRRQIAARKGHSIMKFDYGQIEARVIAMASRDPVFVKSLWERLDVHGDWAKRILKVYPKRVGGADMVKDILSSKPSDEAKKALKGFRTDIKNQWTFPAFFGAQLPGIAGYLNIPQEVLEPLWEEFWDEFRGVKKWQERLKKDYERDGYVTYLTGRRRNGPMTDNQLFNSPIQGPTADIVLDGMRRLSRMGDPYLQPIFNIHDDLTFELPNDRIDTYAETIITEMLAVPFDFVNVPITVEAAVGPNWCDTEGIGDFSSDKWKIKHPSKELVNA